MVIVCITIARSGSRAQQGLLMPLQLLAMAGDLIDAGHTLHWIDESLQPANENSIIYQVEAINPDVVFFAGSDAPEKPLMANIAVKTNSLIGNAFICDEVMRPAEHWCDTLTRDEISTELLIEKIQCYQKISSLQAAGNDCYICVEPDNRDSRPENIQTGRSATEPHATNHRETTTNQSDQPELEP